MATKEELDILAEIGQDIPDEDQRRRHLYILQQIAEKMGFVLDVDGRSQEQNDAEEEQVKREIMDDEDRKDQELEERIAKQKKEEAKRREEEEKRKQEERLQAERKIQQERQEKQQNEERARKQAEQRKKEQEEKQIESQRKASYRKSMPTVGSLRSLHTGNSLEETVARINPKPTARSADLTDPSIPQVYVELRDDNHPTDWMILRYDGESNKLKVTNSGTGGFEALAKCIVEEPLYGYFRYTFGDTSRTKFIFVSYVPEKLGGIKKAKIAGHKPEVAAFLKYFHVEINALSRDELSTKSIENKLRSAGGADYGSGRGGGTSGGENFGGIKANAASFYAKTDKESKVEIVYTKGPLTTTPIDLSGRPMVAAASEARKNIVDLH